MPDTWIDDHTGDETIARQDFRAQLRSDLAGELRARSPRRTPWKAIGWATVAAAAAVTTVVLVAKNDADPRVVPGETPQLTTEVTTEVTTNVTSVADDLVIPAEGGAPLDPTVIATLDFPNTGGAPLVALLPDRIVVLTLNDPGTVASFDREGNVLPATTIDMRVNENTGLVLGGHDNTLYVVANSDIDNSQTVNAFQLIGGRWQGVGSTVVEENNDGVYGVTGEGLVLGDTVVLAAQTSDPSIPGTGWTFHDDAMQVYRVDPDGTRTTWNIDEQFQNFSIPSATNSFGDGVLFLGNASGTQEQRYIGILRPDGGSEFFRPDDWQLSGVDADAALFYRVTNGVVTLGLFGS